MEKQVHLQVKGMFCENCPVRIEKALRKMKGVKSASASFSSSSADVVYDSDKVTEEKLISVIEGLDYQVEKGGSAGKWGWLQVPGLLAVIAALFLLLQRTGILNRLVPGGLAESGMGYGMLFVTGLLTSVHCIAMCGGINLAQSLPAGTAGERTAGLKRMLRPSLLYNLGRVCSYTVIGAVLGTVGFLLGGRGEAGVPVILQSVLKMAAGAAMVLAGFHMLGLFRSLRIPLKLPASLAHLAGKWKAGQPFAIGILNGFMPCGPLQLMWVVALASGSPVSGALSMFFFAAGTVPLMLGLGTVVSALGRRYAHQVLRVGAVLVVVLGLAMFSQGGTLAGWKLPGFLAPAGTENAAEEAEQIQVVNSQLSSRGYPSITVRKGIPVRWVIEAKEEDITSCNVRMQIPAYELHHAFQPGENVIEFLPEEEGTFPYSCWMGMIYGSITVTG